MYQELHQLDAVLEESKKKGVFIFKHSVSCPISASAKERLDKFMIDHPQYSYFIVIIQEQRELSNQVEKIFQIKHESPQLLFLKEGKVLFVLNHYDIRAGDILKKLEEIVTEK